MEQVKFMNMCMIYQQEKVLVMKRESKDWPGITFPGGHVEYGESFVDAMIREIKEETGLTINAPRICGVKNWLADNIRYVVLLYKTDQFEGEVVSSDEGEVWWEEFDNLGNLELASGMKDMLCVFKQDDLSEIFYYKESQEWRCDLK